MESRGGFDSFGLSSAERPTTGGSGATGSGNCLLGVSEMGDSSSTGAGGGEVGAVGLSARFEVVVEGKSLVIFVLTDLVGEATVGAILRLLAGGAGEVLWAV